jgi:hypothetical protein
MNQYRKNTVGRKIKKSVELKSIGSFSCGEMLTRTNYIVIVFLECVRDVLDFSNFDDLNSKSHYLAPHMLV